MNIVDDEEPSIVAHLSVHLFPSPSFGMICIVHYSRFKWDISHTVQEVKDDDERNWNEYEKGEGYEMEKGVQKDKKNEGETWKSEHYWPPTH